MNKAKRSWGIWALGLALLVSSVGGAVWVVHTQAGDEPGVLPDGTRPTFKSNVIHRDEVQGAVCKGFVDVDPKVINLHPVAAGLIVDLPVKEGQTVKEGTPLLQVDDRQAQNNVHLAEADVMAAKARLEDAKRGPAQKQIAIATQEKRIEAVSSARMVAQSNFERVQELLRDKNASAKEAEAAQHKLEEAKAAMEGEVEGMRAIKLKNPENDIALAEANLKAKEAILAQAKLAVDMCTLKAPVDGKVLRVFVAKGEAVGSQSTTPVIQLCPVTPRIVRVSIEQEYVPRVHEGMKVEVEDDVSNAPGIWHGVVRKIDDYFTPKRPPELLSFNDVKTVEAIVDLDPGQPPLKINQQVRVKMGPIPGH